MPIRVLDSPHTGVTVRSLDRAVHLFETVLGLKIQRRNHLLPPISTIVGCDHAEINIAIVQLPGAHLLELLEYASPSDTSNGIHKPHAWQLGSWHLCLTVEDLATTVAELRAATWRGASMGWDLCNPPQRLASGPNAGRALCYLRDDEGMVIELFEGKVVE